MTRLTDIEQRLASDEVLYVGIRADVRWLVAEHHRLEAHDRHLTSLLARWQRRAHDAEAELAAARKVITAARALHVALRDDESDDNWIICDNELHAALADYDHHHPNDHE